CWRAKLARPDEGVRAYVDTGGPRHFPLMLLEIFLASLRPPQRHFHRIAHARRFRRIFGALIECHDDVRTEANLSLNRLLGAQKMRRAVEVRAKCHSLLGDLSQITEAENLKP